MFEPCHMTMGWLSNAPPPPSPPPPPPPQVKWHAVAWNDMGCQGLSSPPLPSATRRRARLPVPIDCGAY
ncbi:unnamed protein product [Prunus armeniaca]